MNALMDPFAVIRNMQFQTPDLTAVIDYLPEDLKVKALTGALSPQEAWSIASSLPEAARGVNLAGGMGGTDVNRNALGGFESKFSNFNLNPDGTVSSFIQNPGDDKYGTMRATWSMGPDGQWTLANDPNAEMVRQRSSADSYKDAAEAAGGLAALAGGAYLGGTALANGGLGGVGGLGGATTGTEALGTLGTIPAGPGPVASLGMSGLSPATAPAIPALSGGGGLPAFLSSPGFWGPAVSAGIGLYGQQQAVKAARDGNNAQLQLLREINDQNRAADKPLLDLRNSVLPKINALMNDPSSVQNDPGYQFGLNQGNNLLANRQAASGGYYSGGALKEASKFNQDYAGTKLTDSLNRLLGVAQMGQIGADNQQKSNTNYGNQAGNALMNGGNIRGSGYIGMTNTVGGAVNDWFNNYQRKQLGGP